jgi:hypothetical protein
MTTTPVLIPMFVHMRCHECASLTRHMQAGVCGSWQAVGPSHKQRYLRYGEAAQKQQDVGGGSPAAQACHEAGDLMDQVGLVAY